MSRARSFVLVAAPLLAVACGGVDEVIDPVDTTASPERDVSLIVDDLGITHVYAQSDEDAFFGAGYAMARDRLFQMELVRRRALGTLAEVLGETALGDDAASRAIGFARLGAVDEALVRDEHPDDARLVDAWADGVNRRIAQLASGAAPRPYGLGLTELDLVPEPWTAAHAYTVGKLLAFGLSNTLDPEILATALLRLVPETIDELPLQLPAYDVFILDTVPGDGPPSPLPPPPSAAKGRQRFGPPRDMPAWRRWFAPPMASNNWAIHGDHTDNGRSLLAGDPHQSLTSPTRLWPVHMSSVDGGGTLDVIGFGFVGTPTVQLGHNARVGWTATTSFLDVIDVWDVSVDADFGFAEVGGEPRAIASRVETILVRAEGAPFGTSTAHALTVREVPGFGVLLPAEALPVPPSFLADGELLLNWTGFRATAESVAYVAIDRARDLDAFEAAAGLIDVGAVNFVAASATSIGYLVHGALPDRGDPAARPMPWHTIADDDPGNLWDAGDLDPALFPRLRDPARGWIATANNDPFGFTADGTVENDPFYFGAFYDRGFRAYSLDRALSALVAGGPVTREHVESLQRDVGSPMAETLVPALVAAVAAIGEEPSLDAFAGRDDLVELCDRLAAWDGRFTRDRGEPVAMLAVEWFAAKRAFQESVTPSLFDAVASRAPPFVMGLLRNVVEERFAGAASFTGGDRNLFLLSALDDAHAWLTSRFGTAEPTAFPLEQVLSALFTTEFGGDLAVDPIPVGGSMDTLNVAGAPFFQLGEPLDALVTSEMALHRMVIGFDEDGTPRATVDFARGTREDPTDPHFSDQQATWAAAEHVELPFRRADVDARATEKGVLPGRN